jgi:hypothetical protein
MGIMEVGYLLFVLILATLSMPNNQVDGFAFRSRSSCLPIFTSQRTTAFPRSVVLWESSSSRRQLQTQDTVNDLFQAISTNDSNEKIAQLVQQLEQQDYTPPATLMAGATGKAAATAVVVATTGNAASSALLSPLFGFYNVTHTLKTYDRDNPVGGQWTRNEGLAQVLLSTRRTMQHVLPYNQTGLASTTVPNAVAEAINVVVLQALGGLLHLTVMLRGDAITLSDQDMDTILAQQKRVRENNIKKSFKKQMKKKNQAVLVDPPIVPPLSNRAVRVYFDPPRIQIGFRKRTLRPWLNCRIGPTSSVVLDATYVDQNVRIGMGGTSGTRFVFGRCTEDDEEAKDCIVQLQQPLTNKIKVILGGLSVALAGLYATTMVPTTQPRVLRIFTKTLGSVLAFLSLSFMGLVVSSTGGIERNGMSYQAGKEIKAQWTQREQAQTA